MKQFKEKLIARLEELYDRNDKMKKKAYEEQDWEKFDLFNHRCEGVYSAISIVNEIAEEYKSSIPITHYDLIVKFIESEIERTSSFAEHDTQINIMNYVQQLQEHNGWIPCSERLPEEDGKQYMVQKTNGLIDILGFTKDAYKLSNCNFAEYKGKKKQLFYGCDSEYGYYECKCEAWQPLPPKYEPKGE